MNESKDLKRIQEFVTRLKSTNSTNDKIDIIKEYDDDYMIKQVLKYTYSPFKQFHLTSATVKKNKKLEPREGYDDLFYLLDALTKRTITGHDAIQYVKGYVQYMDEWQQDLVFCIIDKNLKTRTGADLINKAIPGCIPTFKVALANSYDKQKGKVDFNEQTWFASQKLDGVRCLAMVDENGKCNFYSRQGKTFDTLDNLRKEIESLDLCNMVFDGEVCMVDENGVEDFQGIMKEIKRKDHTIENPKYKIFDYLMLEEFDDQESERNLSDRLTCFNMIYNFKGKHLNCIDLLEQWKVESEEHFQDLAERATKNNWEGLILRKDCEYKGKRSNDLLKVKKFFDEEYVVKSIETSIHRIIVDGLEVEEEMLSNVIIEHKGCEVGVGSGFDQTERRTYFNNPERIIGKTITVQYFEETLNQDGCHSLRFPVVKHIYENGRNV
jgi:DNA ligase-1